LIKNKEVDGEVAGAQNATGDVLRPAFQIVKTLPGVSVVSGAFIMIFPDKQWGDNGVMVFADCAGRVGGGRAGGCRVEPNAPP